VSPGSLTVNLYGTPVDRRVESETSPLTITGKVPVKKLEDPTLVKGKRVVELVGAPPRATEVHRTVYGADGTLLYENTWRSAYVGEPTVVRVGTKRPPKKPKPALGKDGKPEAAAVAGGPAGVRPPAPKGAGSPTGAPTLP
jgi:uncharacterized protein YabE (DUF348 family)